MTERAEPPESEASAVYRRLRSVFGDPSLRSRDARRRAAGKASGSTTPYGTGRDPSGLADILDGVSRTMGWTSPLARGELLTSWPDLVGPEIASHTEPVAIDDGVLSVQCDSTAWATQLRMMRGEMVTSITQRYPDAQITSIRFLGPSAPSWKRGPRSIPGRGPRDTYG
ncbi:putative nucleic acid-binding Zn ribbon protein [Microcella putealis]|uniref:Putative nucleic acid-binding Zn ribbon protein n=1 Tax=Microcella putealis TaxID=337005 RepID=A0A4Q7LPM7_9MICO|nr:DciA family protein [Microcella putealis]RZS56243.1 putative nucleic acid-binding Zn ribbon protein [Microcella putealis]TQM27270.1 putative nucleic acid-binding Zn ribbon protein [Microcella putealis]